MILLGFLDSIKQWYTGDFEFKERDDEGRYDWSYITRDDDFSIVQGDFDDTILAFMQVIISAASTGEIKLRKNGELVVNDFADALTYHPSNSQTFIEFMGQVLYNLKIYGEAFILVVREKRDGVVIFGMEGYKRMEVIENHKIQVEYNPTTDAPEFYFVDSDRYLTQTNVIHLTNTSNIKGRGRSIGSLYSNVKVANNKIDEGWQEALSNNKVGYYLKVNDTNRDWDPKSAETLRYIQQLQNLYITTTKRGTLPLVVNDRVVEVKEMPNTFSTGSVNTNLYSDYKRLVRENAAMLLNIDLSLLSGAIDSTGSKYDALIRQTIVPFYRLLEDELNKALLTPKQRKDGYRLSIESPELFAARYSKVATTVNGLMRSGVLTVNETRELINKGSIEGGDDLRVSADLVDVDFHKDSGDSGGDS